MRGPPDPETRNRPAGDGTAYRRTILKKPEEITETTAEIQARKLRRLYSFCHATACTIASLAFAGGPR